MINPVFNSNLRGSCEYKFVLSLIGIFVNIIIITLDFWKQYEFESILSFVFTIGFSINLSFVYLSFIFFKENIITFFSIMSGIFSIISFGLHCTKNKCFPSETFLYISVLIYFFPFCFAVGIFFIAGFICLLDQLCGMVDEEIDEENQ